jgi:hypothetical protein
MNTPPPFPVEALKFNGRTVYRMIPKKWGRS